MSIRASFVPMRLSNRPFGLITRPEPRQYDCFQQSLLQQHHSPSPSTCCRSADRCDGRHSSGPRRSTSRRAASPRSTPSCGKRKTVPPATRLRRIPATGDLWPLPCIAGATAIHMPCRVHRGWHSDSESPSGTQGHRAPQIQSNTPSILWNRTAFRFTRHD